MSVRLNHVSLCAGYGGIDIGLQRVLDPIHTVAYSEIEGYPVANLIAKMNAGKIDPAPVWSNLKTFPWEEFKGKIDILSGGFPCQPFSMAGMRAGDQDPRHLWPHIVKGAKISQPPILFFENVTGIISSKLSSDWGNDVKGTPVLLHVLREMERMGYHATWCRTAASIYGASHKRTRVFIMGVSRSLGKDQLDIVSERVNSYVHTPTKYPAPRGQEQYDWEAPRMVERNLADPNHLQIAHHPKESLKLIGNGVVPDCASGSFVRCWEKVLKYVDRT